MFLRFFQRRWQLAICMLLVLAGCTSQQPHWKLDNVTGKMPDLAFNLTNDLGQKVTAKDYRDKVVMLYFGYTHCPDVCPLTMVRLRDVMKNIGKKAASHVQVLFVTVDPARDTVSVLHQYVNAFDPRFVGLRGDQDELAPLVKRYGGVYEIEEPIPANGNYLVRHGSAIYIFGPKGRIRLLASSGSTVSEMAHDIKILVRQQHGVDSAS